MIKFNQVFCEDLRDDFEEIGRDQRNFELSDFILGDLSRAFAFGYCHLDWIKEKMWFPVSVRKTLRHLGDDLDDYTPQFEWLNSKYHTDNGKVKIEEYANYILDNVFCDDPDELIKLAILLGTNLSLSSK